MMIGLVTIPVILPVSLVSFYLHRPMIGWFALLIVIMAAVNSYTIWRHGRVKVPFWVTHLAIHIPIIWGMFFIGPQFCFWSYPVAIAAFFGCRRQVAVRLILITFVAFCGVCLAAVDTKFATRFLLTYGLTCFFMYGIIVRMDHMQRRLSKLAITDPLTAAYNRRFLDSCLDDITNNKRSNDWGLIAIDIDHFKNINDEFGHSVGDATLKAVVSTINELLETNDRLFRTGGEEFVVLTQSRSEAAMKHRAELIRHTIDNTEFPEGIKLTVSLGISYYRPGLNYNEWLKETDQLLYQAKNSGRNQVSYNTLARNTTATA